MTDEVIYTYTVEQAIKDGELIDVSHWANPIENVPNSTFFTGQVVFSRPLWDEIIEIGMKVGIGEVNAYKTIILGIASEEVAKFPRKNPLYFTYSDSKDYKLFVHRQHDDKNNSLVTIGFSDDY